MTAVTLVITSCGRHDLLDKTLRSFCEFNTFPIAETGIVEDGSAAPPEWLKELPQLGPVKWIRNNARKGQVYSVDRAYAEVETPYIFHCEDDWEYTRSGFIEESLQILEYADLRRNEPMWTASLRGNDCNGHPNVYHGELPFQIQEPYWHGFWGGCNWNPGLRRLSDYERIGSYGRICGYGQGGIHAEQALSKMHLDMGYRIAVLPEQAVKHIGERRSRACEKLADSPKVLLAIPACHRYQYKEYQDKRIGHVDRISNDRIAGIRETWAKDVSAFRNVDLRFFYGRPGVQSDDVQEDEVMLDVADDYVALPHKVKAIVEYALAHGYDYLFKADDDTFVYVDRLMASGFENRTYTGYCYPSHGNYISGGPGYWLNRKAMDKVAAAAVEGWAEDKWVGETLRKSGIRPERDGRYLPGFDRHYVELDKLPERHGYISFHACTPEMMQKLYQFPPRPTFQLQHAALGEGHYPNAERFELNVRPVEQVFHDGFCATAGQVCDGTARDPRRPQALQV